MDGSREADMRDRPRIVGGAARPVKAALALVLLAGCFWRSYGPQAAAHVDVLVGVARKGADLVGGGRFSAESMSELTYPLERAVAFARKARARARGTAPESLLAMEALIERYREFVSALDGVRRDHAPEDARVALADPLAAVESAGRSVREALAREGRL